jgi:hypothetical protein
MKSQTSYSMVLEEPVGRVWATVRDFNSYPVWVEDVTESRIEGDLPGTTVGAVRDFVIGGSHVRQRLLAHSDVDRAFTFESCEPMELEDESGRTRTLHAYRGTVALRAVDDGDGCFAEWSTVFECPSDDHEFWNHWWATAVPGWLGSLRDHLQLAG